MTTKPRFKTPTVNFCDQALLINKPAADLLGQDTNFVAVILDPETGIVSLKPLLIPDCYKVVRFQLAGKAGARQSRISFRHDFAIYPRTSRISCEWDEERGQLTMLPMDGRLK